MNTARKENNGAKKKCFLDKALLLDWDDEKNKKDPSDYAPYSNKRVYWKCHVCGHKWGSTLNNRTKLHRGCPCCNNRVLVPGKNDLSTKYPELAKEWHPTKNGDLKPCDVFSSQNKKVWWLCPNGHEYQATINHRSGKLGTNCPICYSGRQTSFREQALYYYVRQMYPDAINRYKTEGLQKFELDIFIPSFKIAIEYDGEAWHKKERFEREHRKFELCKNLGIYLYRIKEKMPEEFGLDIANTIISGDFETDEGFTRVIHNTLEQISFNRPYLLNPLDINLSRDRFEIMKYATQVKDSFADKYPEKAKEWHPTKNHNLKPNKFKSGSNFKAWWLCPKCGNEYEQTIAHKSEGNDCPKCAIKKVHNTRRINNIKQNGSFADSPLSIDWNKDKNIYGPEYYTKCSNEKVWWFCHKCGHEWQERISNRVHGRNCPKCAGRKLFVGYNDLATKCPELLKEWDIDKNKGIDPSHIHYGSNKPVWWKCSKCGYEYKAPVARRSHESGCRKCADKANRKIKN